MTPIENLGESTEAHRWMFVESCPMSQRNKL